MPTRELALQTLAVAKQLSHRVGFSSVALVGGARQRHQKESLRRGVDLIIATPGRMMQYRAMDLLRFKQLKGIAFDEVDTLMDDRGEIRRGPRVR